MVAGAAVVISATYHISNIDASQLSQAQNYVNGFERRFSCTSQRITPQWQSLDSVLTTADKDAALKWIAQHPVLNPSKSEAKTKAVNNTTETYLILFHYSKVAQLPALSSWSWLTDRGDLTYDTALPITFIQFQPEEEKKFYMYNVLIKSQNEIVDRGFVQPQIRQ